MRWEFQKNGVVTKTVDTMTGVITSQKYINYQSHLSIPLLESIFADEKFTD